MLYFDHIFVTVIALVWPVAGYLSFERLLRRLRDFPMARTAIYRNTLLAHWSMAFLLACLWIVSGRKAGELGLELTIDGAFYLGTAVVLFCIALLAAQTNSLFRAAQSTIDRLSQGFGRVALLVPQNRSELHVFYLVSVTAGIVEELLWRGYLLWYLTHIFSLPTSAICVTLGFGLAHAYQGWRNVPKITLVSAVFTALYLLTGSIWLSIVLHITVDVMQGRLAYEIFRRSSHAVPESA